MFYLFQEKLYTVDLECERRVREAKEAESRGRSIEMENSCNYWACALIVLTTELFSDIRDLEVELKHSLKRIESLLQERKELKKLVSKTISHSKEIAHKAPCGSIS